MAAGVGEAEVGLGGSLGESNSIRSSVLAETEPVGGPADVELGCRMADVESTISTVTDGLWAACVVPAAAALLPPPVPDSPCGPGVCETP